MLIQGGTISSGRLSTVAVDGAYWMSCISSFSKITLPGVSARLRPTSNILGSDWRIWRLAVPGLDVLGQHVHAAHEILGVRGERLAQQLRIGQHEVRRRDRVGDLPHVEIGLLQRVRIEPSASLHQPVRPLHRQQIGLLEEIEELVARPFRIGEALVPGVGRGDRLDLLARHALDRIGPEVEIGLAEARLQLERALRIAQPIVRDLAERFHHIGDLGVLVVDAALLARLEVGGQRPAALFHHAGDVAGELLHVGGADFDRF